jgi:hypothetical protein
MSWPPPKAQDQLRVMAEEGPPDDRPIVRRDPLGGTCGPLFLSYGNLDLRCGRCEFVLMHGAPSAAVLRDAVLVCPMCNALNETWDTHFLREQGAVLNG